MLHHKLEEWRYDRNDGKDFPDHFWYYRSIEIKSNFLKHVIRPGGRILRKLEGFVGVFAFIDDLDRRAQVTFLGHPRSCLLAEFIVEMICEGHSFIIESLIENGV